MNVPIWIAGAVLAIVAGLVVAGLCLDVRNTRERNRAAIAAAAKRRQWEHERAAASRSHAAQAARDADPVPLVPSEERLFEEITRREEGWFAPGIAEAAQERLTREGDTA